jgi:hypothetical protein
MPLRQLNYFQSGSNYYYYYYFYPHPHRVQQEFKRGKKLAQINSD